MHSNSLKLLDTLLIGTLHFEADTSTLLLSKAYQDYFKGQFHSAYNYVDQIPIENHNYYTSLLHGYLSEYKYLNSYIQEEEKSKYALVVFTIEEDIVRDQMRNYIDYYIEMLKKPKDLQKQ